MSDDYYKEQFETAERLLFETVSIFAEAIALQEHTLVQQIILNLAEEREKNNSLRAELAALKAGQGEAVNREFLELKFLESWLREAAEPIGQECCGRGLNGECCGCPDPVYPDIEHIGRAMNDRREELRAILGDKP